MAKETIETKNTGDQKVVDKFEEDTLAFFRGEITRNL